ncbi:MAG: N-acetylmuramoyl-L-alanine amidase [Pontiellaceae bacterium]
MLMSTISRSMFTVAALAGVWLPFRSVFAGSGSIVELSAIARLYSMRMQTISKKIVLNNKYNTLEIEENGRRAWINGVMFWLHEPCRRSGRSWAIRKSDFQYGIDPVLRSYMHVPKRVPMVVVIDPGHGGKDSGAVGSKKVFEKQVVLDISYRMKKLLENHGFKVVMTRNGDQYLSLDDRADLARKVKADLFLSIHADGAISSAAHGVETFITTAAGFDSSNHYGKGGDQSAVLNNRYNAMNAILGYAVQSNLLKMSGRSDRGLRRARFAVIKQAPCPAALVECGFLTNPEEEQLLRTEAYRSRVAQGIVNGVRAYRTLVSRVKR